MDDLLRMADDAGIRVMWRDLGRRRGEYRHSARLITLNPRMSEVLQRSTLAHELGHAHHGDTWTDDPRLLEERERRADAYAARLLVDPVEYALAERLVGEHPGAIARELGVSRYVVDAWRAQQAGRLPVQRRTA